MCARVIQSAEIISDIILGHLDADFRENTLEIVVSQCRGCFCAKSVNFGFGLVPTTPGTTVVMAMFHSRSLVVGYNYL